MTFARSERTILALAACTLAFIHEAGRAVEAQAVDMRALRIELVVFRGLGERQIAMVEREEGDGQVEPPPSGSSSPSASGRRNGPRR